MLRCVCGAEVRDVNDLLLSNEQPTVIKARCKNSFCKLAEVFRIVISNKTAEVRFSVMFGDYNVLTMGSDALEKKLEELARNVVEKVFGGKDLKTSIKYR